MKQFIITFFLLISLCETLYAYNPDIKDGYKYAEIIERKLLDRTRAEEVLAHPGLLWSVLGKELSLDMVLRNQKLCRTKIMSILGGHAAFGYQVKKLGVSYLRGKAHYARKYSFGSYEVINHILYLEIFMRNKDGANPPQSSFGSGLIVACELSKE